MKRITAIICIAVFLLTGINLQAFAAGGSVTAKFRIDNLVEFKFEGVSGKVTIYGSDDENGANKVLIGSDIDVSSGTWQYDASQSNPEYYSYYWITDGSGNEYFAETYFIFPRRSKEITNLTHPFVVTNQENVDRTKELIKTDEFYKKKFEEYKKTTDSLYNSVMVQEKSKPRGENNYNLDNAVFDGAVMYVLTEDQKYLDLYRHACMLMVEHLRDEEAFETETKNDMWYSEKAMLAYDLVYNYLNEVDRQVIENGLLRRWVEVSNSLSRGVLNNIGGNNPTNLIAGLVLKDQEMVERAVDRELYGMKYQLLNGVNDDGSLWNYPSMYFSGIVEDFYNLGEYMWFSGYDVYSWSLSGSRPTEWESGSQNYRDVENGDLAEVENKKPLEETLEFALAYVYPDMFLPPNGDTSRGTYSLKQNILMRVMELANLHYDDPRIDYLLRLNYTNDGKPDENGVIKREKGNFTDIYDMFNVKPYLDDGPDYTIGSKQFAQRGYSKVGSSVFRDYGQLVFRSYDTTDKAVNSTLWWKNYYENGHGHNDIMNITVFGAGTDVVYDPGSYTYGTAIQNQYAQQAVAHNVVLIDKKNYTYPDYSSEPAYIHKGFLSAAAIGPVAKAGKIWTDRAYVNIDPNHKLERTLWQIDDYVIDVFNAKLSGNHSFDYLLNIDAEKLSESTVKMKAVSSSATSGYTHILPYNQGSAYGIWSNTYSMENGGKFRITMVGNDSCEIMPSKAPSKSGLYDSEKLVVRKTADNEATFISIMEPITSEESFRTITPVNVTLDGKTIDWSDAFTVTGGENGETDTFMYGYSYGARVAGDLTSDGETAFLRVDADGNDTALGGVGMKYISGKSVALKFNTSSSAQFAKVDNGLWRLDTSDGDQVSGKVTVYGLDGSYSVYKDELSDEHNITKLDATGNSFDFEPNSIYYLAKSEETLLAYELPVAQFESAVEEAAPTYDEERTLDVKDLVASEESAAFANKGTIIVEAEDLTTSKGDSTINFVTYATDSHSTKNEKGTGIYGWDTAGTKITWKFNSPRDGKYKVIVKYATANDTGAYRAFSVNDEEPYVVYFGSTGAWSVRHPGLLTTDGENVYTCELKKGENVLVMDNINYALNLDCILFVPVN